MEFYDEIYKEKRRGIFFSLINLKFKCFKAPKNEKNDDISFEFLQNLSKNLKGLSEYFSQKENQLKFLLFLKKLQKNDINQKLDDYEIIFSTFCAQVIFKNFRKFKKKMLLR